MHFVTCRESFPAARLTFPPAFPQSPTRTGGPGVEGEKAVPDSRPKPDLTGYALAGQVGAEMVAPLVLGLVIDSQMQTTPVWSITGAVLGFLGGMTHLVLLARRSSGGPRAGK